MINLGEISEDVLPDNQHEFENVLPADGSNENVEFTPWGKVSSLEYLTEFFENSATARENQDVGLDGLKSSEEYSWFFEGGHKLGTLPIFSESDFDGVGLSRIRNDVAADDFEYFLSEKHNRLGAKVLERYKNFNGIEGNSPLNASNGNFTASSTNTPDKEAMNTSAQALIENNYREYQLDLKPNQLRVGENNIVDKVVNRTGEATWYLFRIPIESPSNTVGEWSKQSNKHIRMYMTGWDEPVVLRLAKFQLVASQWRKSMRNLKDRGFDVLPETGTSDFEVSVVNIEENSQASDGKPPYLLPPGITRDRDNTTTISRQVNEQSLKICVENLEDGDARAVWKLSAQDLVNYGRIKMFFHAEQYQGELVNDGEMTGFIRLGLDQTENYYEIEVPLEVTPNNAAPYSDTDHHGRDVIELWVSNNR